MVRPKWLLALLVALALAATFAALGQWQLQRAIQSGTAVTHPTETIVPLARAATPSVGVRDASVGQLIRTSGHFVPGDENLVAQRVNRTLTGWWVLSHFELAKPDADGRTLSLAVARGWAPTEHAARAAADRLREAGSGTITLTGRLLPSEDPQAPNPNQDPRLMTQVSAAALVNLWHGTSGGEVYDAYVTDRTAPPGLAAIYSPAPLEQSTLDWLNLFYAAEWALFAGFAVYFWYRVVRDAWEREIDPTDEGAPAAAVTEPRPTEPRPTEKVD